MSVTIPDDCQIIIYRIIIIRVRVVVGPVLIVLTHLLSSLLPTLSKGQAFSAWKMHSCVGNTGLRPVLHSEFRKASSCRMLPPASSPTSASRQLRSTRRADSCSGGPPGALDSTTTRRARARLRLAVIYTRGEGMHVRAKCGRL